MFESARIKLTAWYLVIIMFISIIFSVAFYNVSTREIRRFIRMLELRQEFRSEGIPTPAVRPGNLPTIEDLTEAENHLKIILIIINGIILIIAGGAGYILAGRTLRPIKEMLDEQNRFTTDASHELRTPLTALRAEMEASLFDKHLSIGKVRSLIKSNLEEVIKLQTLSDDLLELAQYQDPNRKKTLTNLSLLQIIEDTLKKVLPLAKKKKITINNQINDIQIRANNNDLNQVFVIIIENAIKYSPEKSKITLSCQKLDHTAEIIITDQGMGINKKDLPFVFDRFYRGDKSRTKTETTGFGLGLSIAKKIIEEHQGSINIESNLGKGTKVILRLPTI